MKRNFSILTIASFIFFTSVALAETQNSITVTPDGKVGVGTATPTEKFEVNGNIKTNEDICLDDDCISKWPRGQTDTTGCRVLQDMITFQEGQNGCDKANYGSCSKTVTCNPDEYLSSYMLYPYSHYWYNGSVDTYYPATVTENSLLVNASSKAFWLSGAPSG